MKTKLEDPKFDGDKVQVDLVDPHFIMDVGRALTYGAEKYEPNSWQRLKDPTNRYYGAALRHLLAWRMGEEFDEESGLPHLAHAATCLMFLSFFDKKGGEDNDGKTEKLRRPID